MKISKKQCTEVGVLAALSCLVIFLFHPKNIHWIWIAMSVLGLVLLIPNFFRPLAFLWFGLSKVLGTISTRILLTLTFFLMVLPIGFLRKRLGKDSLQLKKFKTSKKSVFIVREHTFDADDLKNTF
ncbi:MAG: hypothetical protein AAF575_10330 [Bacteroidota bacterium]|nr:hypothetical protein [uncultured Allomuricauda sp.]